MIQRYLMRLRACDKRGSFAVVFSILIEVTAVLLPAKNILVIRYYSELRARLCVDEDKVDWYDINNSFAQPGNYKSYLSTVSAVQSEVEAFLAPTVARVGQIIVDYYHQNCDS